MYGKCEMGDCPYIGELLVNDKGQARVFCRPHADMLEFYRLLSQQEELEVWDDPGETCNHADCGRMSENSTGEYDIYGNWYCTEHFDTLVK